jgi:hypothetical protein
MSPRPVTTLTAVLSLFEVDYLTVGDTKIYVGQSRHQVLVWLWLLPYPRETARPGRDELPGGSTRSSQDGAVVELRSQVVAVGSRATD